MKGILTLARTLLVWMLFFPALAEESAPSNLITGALIEERFFAGESVYLHGVQGKDVFAAGGEVIFDDAHAIDVFAAGCPVRFGDASARKLYAAGCQIQIDGIVEEGLAVAGGQISFGSDASVGGYVAAVGGQIDLSGHIEGNLHATGGRVGVFGVVGGDARIAARRIHIGPQARIEGDLEYVGERAPRISPGAVVSGEVRRITLESHARHAERESGVSRWAIAGFALLFWFAAVIGFSILVWAAQLMMPRALDAAAQLVKVRPWASLGLGFALFITVPAATGLLAFTVVGIPLAMVGFAAYLPACALGLATAAYWLGCPSARSAASPEPSSFWRFAGSALGIVILALVILIPALGTLAVLLATATGLGAFVLSFRRERALR